MSICRGAGDGKTNERAVTPVPSTGSDLVDNWRDHASVGQVLPCYEVLHDLDRQLNAVGG
jgi:hypothetical protein